MTEVEIVEENMRDYIKSKLGLDYDRVRIEKNYENGSWVAKITSVAPYVEGSAGFRIYGFPGCCKYAIISQIFTKGAFSGVGLVKYLLDWAEMIGVYDHEVSTLVGTTADGPNSVMVGIAERYGWKQVHDGDNPNSGNWVRMFVKELDVPDEDSEEEDW
jgi:hypothetical protein